MKHNNNDAPVDCPRCGAPQNGLSWGRTVVAYRCNSLYHLKHKRWDAFCNAASAYRRRAIALRQLATMRRHQYHAAILTLEMVERDRDEYLERLTSLMAVVARTQQRFGVEHLDDIETERDRLIEAQLDASGPEPREP
jgi:hypothetical protein